jgi:hypothetical protein
MLGAIPLQSVASPYRELEVYQLLFAISLQGSDSGDCERWFPTAGNTHQARYREVSHLGESRSVVRRRSRSGEVVAEAWWW